jgi:hypothetical protein
MSDFDVDELRRLERQCLEQAQECARPEGRTALLSLAVDYRAGIKRVLINGRAGSIDRPHRGRRASVPRSTIA